jgi:hypothetical protein
MTITSANTSINKDRPPAIVKLVEKHGGWQGGNLHLDYGCGKYPEVFAKAIKRFGVHYVGADPFNCSEEHNENTWRAVEENDGADSASLSNVLNVIKAEASRKRTLKRVWYALRLGGRLYITVYEGDRSGRGRKTKKDCWQENRKTADYVREVEKVFGKGNVERKGKLIIAMR